MTAHSDERGTLTHTRTHTFTVEHFADPYKVCQTCGQQVQGYVVSPRHKEDGENWPCRHRGYDSVCPSWSPVDGCRCQEHLGHVPHPSEASLSASEGVLS